jgi:hypothetical protein
LGIPLFMFFPLLLFASLVASLVLILIMSSFSFDNWEQLLVAPSATESVAPSPLSIVPPLGSMTSPSSDGSSPSSDGEFQPFSAVGALLAGTLLGIPLFMFFLLLLFA